VDLVTASIPLFFLLIGVELLVARWRHHRVYRLADSLTDLSLGTMSQLAGVFVAVGTIALYAWVAAAFSVQSLIGAPAWIARPPWSASGADLAAAASWATVFLLDDLAYYWTHRCSHEVNLLWAGHVVHHSSEEYNLTVALRQSGLHGLFTWVFYLPLALAGVPVTMWVTCHALNLIYQFWIHTREIDRLPRPFEAILNTPSHHRVHHGINPRYQDKNYAGVFIIWDRLFGTFEPEREPPVYGITKPLASWNPVWANLHVFADIARTVVRARGWRDRWRVIFGRPGWRPAELGPSERLRAVDPDSYHKYDPPAPGAVRAYAVVQFAAVVAASLALLTAADGLPPSQRLAGVFYLVVALANIGGLLEGRSWALLAEPARLAVAIVVGIALLFQGKAPLATAIGLAAFAAASMVWVLALRSLGPRVAAVRGPLLRHHE